MRKQQRTRVFGGGRKLSLSGISGQCQAKPVKPPPPIVGKTTEGEGVATPRTDKCDPQIEETFFEKGETDTARERPLTDPRRLDNYLSRLN